MNLYQCSLPSFINPTNTCSFRLSPPPHRPHPAASQVSDKLMCHWSTSTNGLVAAGFSSECSVDGMLKCTFNSKHKLLDMEITYDVMAFTRQMQHHSLIDLSVVANSARSNPMMRTPSSGKLPLRTPGAMMPMAGMKHPNMKRAKSMGKFGPSSLATYSST